MTDTNQSRILTPEAVEFVHELHRLFEPRRQELLAARQRRQSEFDSGALPGFLEETQEIRASDWKVDPVPTDLQDRRVEITGPVDAKMMINALNSGANVFMADFEDATSPTWDNLIEGQANLIDAYRRTLRLETPDKIYELAGDPATLVIRPRGWHFPEKHLQIDGAPASASLVDFGLYLFWGGREAIAAGSGPYLYLPKLESHLEARLWNDVFVHAQDLLGVPQGTIKATVLIETITAAFEMDEILYALRHHSAGLNAGRWDYIFSVIKKLRAHPDRVLPNRSQVTMTVPFMRAYTELQVATCHRRGAHAIGGMAAFVPNRRDSQVTAQALEKVTADKRREAEQGYDGTWVAHPDLVEVARAEFDAVLGDRPNQLDRLRLEVSVTASDLLDTTVDDGRITRAGLRTNVSVALRYLTAWLGGTGAVALDNLMEDAATAEIARSQVWQWIRHGSVTDEGEPVTRALVEGILEEAYEELVEGAGPATPHLADARTLFAQVALGDDFIEFLTLPAYELID